MIRSAIATVRSRGGDLRIFGSPWSPPAWMKGNGQMCHSSSPGLIDLAEVHQAWALYFSKVLSAYESEGIKIWGLTVQNERERGCRKA
jgi:glucosylceramidase